MLKNYLPPEPLPIISPIGTVYTTQETATVLKVSVRTVQRLIRNKKLVSRKVGRVYRILGKDIKAFFALEPESMENLGIMPRQATPRPPGQGTIA